LTNSGQFQEGFARWHIMTNNVIFSIYDGSDAGRDYNQFDIVDIQDGWIQSPSTGVWRLRCPTLPPAAPFYSVRVWNITKAQCSFLMDTVTTGGSVQTKRAWLLRQQNVPNDIKNYFTGHRWVGFASGPTLDADDNAAINAAYGAQVTGDFVIPWSQACDWMRSKQGNQSACSLVT
jgi:hypothetical protein